MWQHLWMKEGAGVKPSVLQVKVAVRESGGVGLTGNHPQIVQTWKHNCCLRMSKCYAAMTNSV